MRRLVVVICHLSFAILLAACAAPPSPTPVTLRVEATDLTHPLLMDLVAAYADANPNVSLLSSVVPASTLSADLAAGRADLGLVVTRNPGQFATPLGLVSFAMVVHPANPLASISTAQVREIFAGRVRDWAQVGGQGGGIQVVSRDENSDAGMTFEASVLGGASLTPNALVAPTWDAVREAVSQDPSAIGYLASPELDGSVKWVRLEAELRALVVAVAPGEPAGPAREFLAWAQSEAGQKIVAQRYEPLR